MTKKEITKKVIEIVSKRITFNYEGVNIESTFEDLGLDSLDLMEILMLLEEEFDINISINKATKMKKLSDLVDYIFRVIADRG